MNNLTGSASGWVLSRRRLLTVLASGTAMGLLASCGSAAAVTTTTTVATPPVHTTASSTPVATPGAATTTASAAVGTATTASASSTASTTSSSAVASAVPAVGPVTLLWTSWAADPEGLKRTQAQADAFLQRFPTMKIDMQNVTCCDPYYNKLQADIAAGTAPDVYRVNPLKYAPYALQGAAKLLDPFIAQAGQDSFASQMYPNVVDAAKLSGKVYGVPMGGDTCALHVNETLFHNAGVPLPPTDWTDPSWTWDAFIEVAQKLTKHTGQTADQYGLYVPWWGLAGPLGSAITMNGGAMIDSSLSTVTLSQGPAVTAIQWAADLTTKQHVNPTGKEMSGFDFAKTGKAAMYWIYGGSSVAGFEHNIAGKFEYNVYPLPHPAGGAPHGYYHQSYWLIGADTKHPSEAWQFANFLGTPAGQGPDLVIGFTVPLMDGAKADFLKSYPTIHKQVIAQAVALAVPWRFPVGYDKMDAAATTALAPVFAGTETAATAVAKVQTVLQQDLGKVAT